MSNCVFICTLGRMTQTAYHKVAADECVLFFFVFSVIYLFPGPRADKVAGRTPFVFCFAKSTSLRREAFGGT